jgi:hypothetical protein
MTRTIVEQIAYAVLYEGYILYPYRPSSLKNRQRWNFGGLCPRAYSDAQNGNEPWCMQTECLARGDASTKISIRLRFLHLVDRRVAIVPEDVSDLSEGSVSDLEFVETLKIGDRLFQSWQEANECEIELPVLSLESPGKRAPIDFFQPGSRTVEPLRDTEGRLAGALVRTQRCLEGSARVDAEKISDSLFKITVQILNLTPFAEAETASRDQAMMYSLVSNHVILAIEDGEFISLLDPPAEHVEAAANCRNVGVYPVLAGEAGRASTILASPVILYDYPTVAPESAGDLFDSAEIDEILTLRIMALTEDEKSEMRQCDERARRILDRIESDPQHLARLHGTMRPVDNFGGASAPTDPQ